MYRSTSYDSRLFFDMLPRFQTEFLGRLGMSSSWLDVSGFCSFVHAVIRLYLPSPTGQIHQPEERGPRACKAHCESSASKKDSVKLQCTLQDIGIKICVHDLTRCKHSLRTLHCVLRRDWPQHWQLSTSGLYSRPLAKAYGSAPAQQYHLPSLP